MEYHTARAPYNLQCMIFDLNRELRCRRIWCCAAGYIADTKVILSQNRRDMDPDKAWAVLDGCRAHQIRSFHL